MSGPRINVMIPTLNEARHVRHVVTNALTVGPVFVLDSVSSDGTQDMAREAGATVLEHPFENYARQKNWGLDNMPFDGDWIFILDADERITPKLREEIFAIARGDGEPDGYFVNRMVLFMGRPIRHGGLFPSWNLRFFRRGRCRYEDRAVHEHMVCDGSTAYLRNAMLHIRRETITESIEKHARYAEMESDEWVKSKLGHSQTAPVGRLFKRSLRLRQWLKREMWPALPFRPFWRFAYMYFVRFGFLDGRGGWHMAMMMASYEYMISLLYKEKLVRIGSGEFEYDPETDKIAPKLPEMGAPVGSSASPPAPEPAAAD